MTNGNRLASLLMLIILLFSGGIDSANPASFVKPANQTVTQANLPPSLPGDCSSGPGGSTCAYGYVYYGGTPVSGANVHIESPYGALDVITASGEASSYPYYQANLSAAPLLVSPGDFITVTAAYGNLTASIAYEVTPDGQQIDIVIPINPLFGTGVDGTLTVRQGETVYIDNTRTALSGDAPANQRVIPVNSVTGFKAGDEVLIIQMQGAEAGNYETGIVAEVDTQNSRLILQQELQHQYRTYPGIPRGEGCASGYKGEYYNNSSLSGSPVFTRCDNQIAFQWRDQSPGGGVGPDNFSVRWTGDLYLPSGTYQFMAAADDWIRVYVDDNLVLDAWPQTAGTRHTGNFSVGTGNHTIKVEFSEGPGDAWVYFTLVAGATAQVVKMPHYQDVIIHDAGKITAHSWDGSTGGIVAFRATGSITVSAGGTIDVAAKCFRGGGRTEDKRLDGVRGEGTWANYGSRGIEQIGGGGGGGRGGDHGGGGGGGGHAYGGGNGGSPGYGGSPYGDASLSSLFCGAGGGGGGGGGSYMGYKYAGGGGSGGGIVLLFGHRIQVDGSITGNGGEGEVHWPGSDGGGGGSAAGGSIKLVGNDVIIPGTVTAVGANAVDVGTATGGAGSAGRIRIEYCKSLSGSTNPLASINQWDCHRPPIPTIHTIYPDVLVQGQGTITFRGSAVDNDENGASITAYVWRSDLDGLLSTQASFTLPASDLSVGTHTIYFKAKDNEGEWSQEVSRTLTINAPTPTPTPPPDSDPYEPDDTCSQAKSIPTDGTIQVHTFHTPGDVDWVSFQATSGTPYLIEALVPPTSTADVVLELYDACDALPSASQDYDFSPGVRLQFRPPHDGTYSLRLVNHDPEAAGQDVVYHLSVRALASTPTPGALVLVAGRIRLNDPLQDNIHNVTNAVYRLFINNGYDGDRIYYLATDLNLDADGDGWPDVDALATKANLAKAITQWAVDKVGPDRALTLYLMDHGGYDRFYLNGRAETVSPDELDEWLDTLEAAKPGVKANVIVEACHSGSFIDLVKTVSKPGRVVIASTGAYALAYASQNGAAFSDAFVEALGQGMSLYGAFKEGEWSVKQAHPDQTPWLDDDGDGWPNEGEDGMEAQRRGFAYSGTLGEEKWPPYIVWAQVGEVKEGKGTIQAEVKDDRGVLSVWAVIYKPSYEPPSPEETDEMVQENLPTVMLLDTDGDGVYGAVYEGFDEVGEYRIVVYAVDGESLGARPREIKAQVGWKVYLPMVMK